MGLCVFCFPIYLMMIVKDVFDELKRLHELCFSNWWIKVNDLAQQFNINLNATDINEFKTTCKIIVQNEFMRQWTSDLRDTAVNPKLRMYRTIKSVFGREPYIDLVNDARYRIAITKIRTSSHSLEIERGRHTNPETPIQLRVCLLCKEVEDEKHFVLSSKKYAIERLELIQKISGRHEYFMNWASDAKYYYMFTNSDPDILSWLGKFLYRSLVKRNSHP